MLVLQLVQVNVQLSQELEQRIEESLDKLDVSSQQAFAALERLATGLEMYARIQTILLGVLVGICVLTLVILLVRDAQLRRLIGAAWNRIRSVTWRRALR